MTEGEEFDLTASNAAREAITAGFRARQQLDMRTMRSLYALLTAEQRAQLPRMPEVDVAEPVTAEHLDVEVEE